MTVNLKDALKTGNKIGYLVWYDCENANITPNNLKMLFDQYGLDEKYFPSNIKPKHAFQQACRAAQTKDGATSDDRRSVVKLISDGVDRLVYGVVDLPVDEKLEEINPDFSDKVWFDKNKLVVSYEKGHLTSQRIKDLFDHLVGEYTTRDISRMIVNGMDRMCSVSLRRAGVIYFVPSFYEKDVLAIQNVVNNIGSCDMKIFEIGDANATSVEKEARSQIQDRISKLKSEIVDMKQSIENGSLKGKSAENSIETRMSRFRSLKNRCQILAEALKVKAENLEFDLEEVGSLIKKELLEVAA